jgi:SPP1 gp7 family putative phage head morphogenesis protein
MSEAAASLISRTDRVLKDMEDAEVRRMNIALDGSYQQFERELLRKYPTYSAEAKPDLLGTQRGVLLTAELKDLLILINPEREQEITARYERLLQTASQEGTTLSDELIQLQAGEDFVKATATVPIEAVSFAAKDAVTRLKKHDDKFREEASIIIAQGLIQGQGARKVAGVLRQRLGVTKSRAETIARTEIISAQDSATRLNYKQNNIEYIVRIATQDSRVCGTCAARAGNVYPVDAAPAVIHPRDRCYNAPWLPEYEESDPKQNEWIKQHARDAQAQTQEPLNYGLSPFEKAIGLTLPKVLWNPQQGYIDKSVEAKGQNWALGLLALGVILKGQQPQPPAEEKNNELLKALLVGAAIAGVGVGSYYLARSRYRAGFKESAQMAEAMAVLSTDADLSNPGTKQQITFVAGGFAGMGGDSGLEYAPMFGEFLDAHHMVGVPTPEFDRGVPVMEDPLKHMATNYSTVVGTAVIDGRNMSSVRMAAMAAAHYRRYGKPVNLIGYSGGGMVASEAMEILKEMGIPAKAVTLGTPWFGFTDLSPEEHLSLMGKGDVFAKLPIQNGRFVDGVESHWLDQYLGNPAFVKEVQDFFERPDSGEQPKSSGLQTRRKRQPEPEDEPQEDLSQPTDPDAIEVKAVSLPLDDDDLVDETIADLVPQLALLSEAEIKALPAAIARKLLAARRVAGLLPGRAEPKQLPGIAEPKALPGYEPLLALPEAQGIRGLLRGQIPQLALPAGVDLAPVTSADRTALEDRIAQNLYRQARSAERGQSRLASFRVRQAIAQINQQKLPMTGKLAALRKAIFDEVKPLARPTSQHQAPGTAAPEDLTSFDFGGVRWYAPGEIKETSAILDLARKVAELDLPDGLTQQLNNIYISRQPNASENFWRKKLKLTTPRVPATANLEDGSITFYRGRGNVDDLLRQSAYLMAYQRFGQLEPPEGSDYRRAMQEGRPMTVYGLAGPAQDFADSVKEFFVDPTRLKRFTPQRYEAIARMLNYRHPEKAAAPEVVVPDTRSPQIMADLRTQNAELSQQVNAQREQAEATATQQRSTKKIQQAIERTNTPKVQAEFEGAISQVRTQEESLTRMEQQVLDLEQRSAQLLNPLNPPYFSQAPKQIQAVKQQLRTVERSLLGLNRVAGVAAKVRLNVQELQQALSDLTTRRESLKVSSQGEKLTSAIAQLQGTLDSAEQELIGLPRSIERTQALRDMQRLRAAINSQRGGLSVADLHRQTLDPQIRQLSQIAENLEGLQQRITSDRNQLASLQQRLGTLPVRVDDLLPDQQDRYGAIKRTRNAQDRLPQRVEGYRQLRQQFSNQLAQRQQDIRQLADNYGIERQAAINNVQAIIQGRLQRIGRNLQILAGLRPGSIAWLLDSRSWEAVEMPDDLAIILQRQPGKTPAERLRSAADEVARLIGQVNAAIREIEKRVDYPNELAQTTFDQAQQAQAQWQQLRDALSDEGKLSDRQLQALLKSPERIKAVDVIRHGNQLKDDLEQFNQEFVNLMLNNEAVDPRTIIDQSELYRRARESFLTEAAQTRGSIAREIEEGIATAESIRQRATRDQAEALVYEVDGSARTVADLQAELEKARAAIKDFVRIPQVEVKVKETAEEEMRQQGRQREIDQTIARDRQAENLKAELAETNREMQKRREAAARGQTRGIAIDRLEARQRRILRDLEKLERDDDRTN